ncbi:MAG TPA: lactonase family protein [Streptosporangiaceae bacterium]|nr:lactonase family protein [Streptosporangiaceae bacterium]
MPRDGSMTTASQAQVPDQRAYQLIVGTYTERLPFVNGRAPGILGCAYHDGTTGAPTLLVKARNPSWLAVTASGRHVYAIHETADFDGKASGGVTAYARDLNTGGLSEINSSSSAGLAPAHIALYGEDHRVLVANYESGSIASFNLDERGGLGALVGHRQHVGSSVDPARQQGPHAHMICVDPVTDRVLVPDLGLDLVLSYEVSQSGEFVERAEERIVTTPGAGPRHLAFHPGRQFLFLLNEINSTLVTLRRDGMSFVETDTKSTLPETCTVHSEAAAVRVSASGCYVFASNRGYDSIAMFSLDEAAGTLTLEHVEPTQGREPRDFCQSPDGKYLLVANQDSDSIVSFAIDEEDATLRQVSATRVPSPVCLIFAP